MASSLIRSIAFAAGLLLLDGCRANDPAAAMSSTAALASVPEGRILVTPAAARALGSAQIRSVLDVPEAMSFGTYVWNDRAVAQGRVWIRVDLSRQLISVFRGGDEIGTAVILYGGNGKLTPTGEFKVLEKVADYRSKTYDAPMPYMMRLTADGVAIHASNVREGWATHGCIGVPLEFAERLYREVKLGDSVSIFMAPDDGSARPSA